MGIPSANYLPPITHYQTASLKLQQVREKLAYVTRQSSVVDC
jgi:hypothetical protein